jgi:CelD/BcsL family acetyltransferase involved in cellulose biosynthesis
MKVDVLPGLTGLDEASWNSLLDRSAAPSVFLTWTWQTEWARAFAPHHALQILAVRGDDGSLAGLLPLYEDGSERLRVLGGVDVSDYLDLIAPAGTEEDVWHALLQHRAVQRVEWDLHAVRAASPTAEILPRIAPSWGLRAVAEIEERCPVLALPATWDGYLATLSGKDRHELKRKARKLERELADVSVRSHAGAEGWDEALDQFLTLHRLSKVGKARFMDERMERFFRDVTLSIARRGWGRLWFLESEGVPVASFLCIEHGRSVGLYNSGFDPAHARLAPGIVLLARVIKDAIERGVPVFDFLRGEESYKRDFGPTAENLLNIRIVP